MAYLSKMASSPARKMTREEKHAVYNIDDKAFGEKLEQIVKHQTNLLKLASHVYSLSKTQRIQYPNGKTVGRKELRSLASQLAKETRSLKKNYVEHGKRKRRTRAPGTTAGFKNPILVTDAMREFFRNANLGPSDPSNLNSAPLNSQLAVGFNGVTTRAIMTPLFNIYAQVNGMQKDPANKQFLTSTPQMDQYFATTYARLAAAPQKFAKADKQGVRKPLPKFDPRRFRYASIQSIVADNTVKKELLTAQQAAVLADQATKDRLEQEQALVSSILAAYRARKASTKSPSK